MVMADSETFTNGTNRGGLSLVPPPLSRSDLEGSGETEKDTLIPPAPPVPGEAAPKRKGRPPGVKNGQGKGAKAKADLDERVRRSQREEKARSKKAAAKPAKKAPTRARAAAPAPAKEAKPAKEGKVQRLARVRSTELQAKAD